MLEIAARKGHDQTEVGASGRVADSLPFEIERQLIAQIQNQDGRSEDAAERLIAAYRRLVYKIVHSLRNRHSDSEGKWDEMVIAGEMAVLRAARKFDLKRPTKFFPYCKCFVYGTVWVAAFEGFSRLSLPLAYWKRALAIRSAFASLGEDASVEEIAEASGVSEETVEQLWSAANKTMELGAIQMDFADPEDADCLETREIADLRARLDILTDVERDSLEAVYGGDDPAVVARTHLMRAADVGIVAGRALDKIRTSIPKKSTRAHRRTYEVTEDEKPEESREEKMVKTRYMSIRTAARVLECSPQLIKKMIERKDDPLPSVHLAGYNLRRIPVDLFDEWERRWRRAAGMPVALADDEVVGPTSELSS